MVQDTRRIILGNRILISITLMGVIEPRPSMYGIVDLDSLKKNKKSGWEIPKETECEL